MKNLRSILTLLLICSSVGLMFQSLTGCISTVDRIETIALFEPAQQAWPAVESDARIGISYAESDGSITDGQATGFKLGLARLRTAISLSDRAQVRMSAWPQLRLYASRGIAVQLADGDIGPGVAESFLEHLANFDKLMKALRGDSR